MLASIVDKVLIASLVCLALLVVYIAAASLQEFLGKSVAVVVITR